MSRLNYDIDLVGKKFGRLLVISQSDSRKGNRYWKCSCNCGNTCYVKTSSLLRGVTRSCGCLAKELRTAREKAKTGDKNVSYTHGKTGTRLYRIYAGMLSRCYNEHRVAYPSYGGRGIYVCDEWYTPGVKGNPGFMAFYIWAYENGYYDQGPLTEYRDMLTIDRIDPDGPYAPWNCRWITKSDQSNNKRTSRYIYDGDERLTWKDFEKKYHLREGWVKIRIKYDWSDDAVVYAAKHQDRGVYKAHPKQVKKKGSSGSTYLDRDGYMVLIPRIT